jgi:hypothetical protein
MNPTERYLSCGRTDQRTEHVALCIPRVSLRSQERVCAASFQDRHTPFKQFVTGADCHADTHDHKNSPPWPGYNTASNQYFSRNNGRNEALGKVAELVIVISLEPKVVAHPVEERNMGISIVTADQKNTCMYGDQKVSEIGEAEPLVRCSEYRNRNQGWKRLQPPCPAITSSHPRPHQYHADTNQKAKRPDKLPSLRRLLRNHCSCFYIPLSFMSTVPEATAFDRHRKSYAPQRIEKQTGRSPSLDPPVCNVPVLLTNATSSGCLHRSSPTRLSPDHPPGSSQPALPVPSPAKTPT